MFPSVWQGNVYRSVYRSEEFALRRGFYCSEQGRKNVQKEGIVPCTWLAEKGVLQFGRRSFGRARIGDRSLRPCLDTYPRNGIAGSAFPQRRVSPGVTGAPARSRSGTELSRRAFLAGQRAREGAVQLEADAAAFTSGTWQRV